MSNVIDKEVKKELDSRIKSRFINSKDREKEELTIKKLLEEGGWIEGEHFIYDGEWKDVETTITTGYSFRNNQDRHEVTVSDFVGKCRPILVEKDKDGNPYKTSKYSSFRLNTRTRGYSTRKYKPTLTCYDITRNWRRYGAKKLLQELIWINNYKTEQIKRQNERKSLYEKSFEYLVGKFITANVTKVQISKYRSSTDGYRVTFENGNYIELIPGYEVGKEQVSKKVDVALESMKDVDEIANYLNK